MHPGDSPGLLDNLRGRGTPHLDADGPIHNGTDLLHHLFEPPARGGNVGRIRGHSIQNSPGNGLPYLFYFCSVDEELHARLPPKEVSVVRRFRAGAKPAGNLTRRERTVDRQNCLMLYSNGTRCQAPVRGQTSSSWKGHPEACSATHHPLRGPARPGLSGGGCECAAQR